MTDSELLHTLLADNLATQLQTQGYLDTDTPLDLEVICEIENIPVRYFEQSASLKFTNPHEQRAYVLQLITEDVSEILGLV